MITPIILPPSPRPSQYWGQSHPADERGNVIFLVILAVVLIGALSAAMMNSGNSDSAGIDREALTIKTSQLRSTAGELERGVLYILRNSVAEDEIRFAHASAHNDYGSIATVPESQLFHPDGGAASYPAVPSNINDGSSWEFYGHAAAPSVGSDLADLIAVLPNVTQDFCAYVNVNNNQPADLIDDGGCIHDTDERFGGTTQYAGNPETFDESGFAQNTTISAVKPAPQGCVRCTDNSLHFYHVILGR